MEKTIQQELWTLMLYLALDHLGKAFEVGFEAYAKDETEANDLAQLLSDLRGEILDIARTRIEAKKVTEEHRKKYGGL